MTRIQILADVSDLNSSNYQEIINHVFGEIYGLKRINDRLFAIIGELECQIPEEFEKKKKRRSA